MRNSTQLKANRPGATCRSSLMQASGCAYGSGDQQRLRGRSDTIRFVLDPEKAYAFQPSMRPDEQSFRKSVELLFTCQLPSGELPLFVSEKPDEHPGRYMKTVFLTAFQAALHADIPDAGVRFVTQRSLRFLLQERSSDGFWRFFGRDSDIDADIDDTFAALCAFRNDAIIRASLPEILRQLQRLQDRSGLFRTWFTRNNSVCDLTVNANLLMFLSFLRVDSDFQEALQRAISHVMYHGDLPVSNYYLSPTTLQFSLSNCLPPLNVKAYIPSVCFRRIDRATSWFVQNARNLFYDSPVLRAVHIINARYYPETSRFV